MILTTMLNSTVPPRTLFSAPSHRNYIFIVIASHHSPPLKLRRPSPAAHVALLQTEIYSGLRLPERIGMNSGMHGCTWAKQALVKSPSRAKLDWRTSGIESWGGVYRIAHFVHSTRRYKREQDSTSFKSLYSLVLFRFLLQLVRKEYKNLQIYISSTPSGRVACYMSCSLRICPGA